MAVTTFLTFAKSLGPEHRKIVGRITLEATRAIALATPIDFGTAKGNWFPTLGAPSREISDAVGANASISRAEALLANAEQVEPLYFITNSLPYIERLNNGWSQQAPANFVEAAVMAAASKYL